MSEKLRNMEIKSREDISQLFIKTPFRYIESKMIVQKRMVYPDLDYIRMHYDEGNITDLDKKMLLFIYRHKFLLSGDIAQLCGFSKINQKLKRRIVKARENGLISEFSWQYHNKDHPENLKGYSIDRRGIDILQWELDKNIKWNVGQNFKPTWFLFQVLQFNKIVTNIVTKGLVNYKSCELYSSYKLSQYPRELKATGTIFMYSKNDMDKESKDPIPFIFYVVRQNDGWEKKLMYEHYDLITTFMLGSWEESLKKKPVFIFCGENDEHIKKINTMFMEKSGYSDICNRLNIKFTTDIALEVLDMHLAFNTFEGDDIKGIKAPIFEL